jgi:hypothetical protein
MLKLLSLAGYTAPTALPTVLSIRLPRSSVLLLVALGTSRWSLHRRQPGVSEYARHGRLHRRKGDNDGESPLRRRWRVGPCQPLRANFRGEMGGRFAFGS